MREILFKAKRSDNGQWIEGHFIKSENGMLSRILVTQKSSKYYMQYGHHDVDPETVCQYTGLKDADGERIFEGDVCADRFGQEYPIVFINGQYWFSWLSVVDAHSNCDNGNGPLKLTGRNIHAPK